ncbi:MAG: MoaD/ThiS family protein [Planctomycetota bacterium]
MSAPDVSRPTGRLRIAMFAGMAEEAGRRTLDLAWSGGTVADLRRSLATACPEIAALLARSTVARGDRYVADSEPIAAGDDLAVIPPVSGG